MIGKWLSALQPDSGPEDEAAAQQRLRLACAVLLVDVARADWEEDPRERDAICHALCEQLGLSAAEADALLDEARDAQEQQVSLHRFLRTINEAWSAQRKRELLQALWRVAFADGELATYEEATVRRLAELLHLPHQDFIQTKLRQQDRAD